MGVKDLSTTQLDFFDSCRRGDLFKVTAYISGKKTKRPKTPLSLFRPGTPGTGWLAAIKDSSSWYTPLHAAAVNGHTEVCRLLIENDSLQVTSKDKRDCLPLHLAAFNGHAETVQILLEQSSESKDALNCAHETPLHLAAQHGHAAVTRLLLKNGANSTLRNARGESPLDIAARTGHETVCQFLVAFCPDLALQSAVDCCHSESGKTIQTVYPLHSAARHSHIQCMKVLREAGFDIDYVTNEGSALHVAAMFGQVEGCRFLIANGINPYIRDSQGRTVSQLLEEQRRQKASDLTQIIQSRDGWEECAHLIEDYLFKYEQVNANSSSDSGIDGREYRNRSEEGEKEIIWKPLPRTKSEKEASYECSPCYSKPPQTTLESLCRNDVYGSSEISIGGATLRRWNSNMYDPVKGTPRFPVTSPYLLAQHKAVDRRTSTMPCSASSARSVPTQPRASILPGATNPPSYENWRKVDRNGTSFTYNPAFPYENVPSTSAVQEVNASKLRKSIGSGSVGRTASKRTDNITDNNVGIHTLPTARRMRSALHMGLFHPIAECPANSGFVSKHEPSEQASIQSFRSDSIGLGGSITLSEDNNRQSSVPFTCSTLERSLSPRIADLSPDGRAPLALPEEMIGSTSTGILSNNSPERETPSFKQNLRSSSLANSVTVTPHDNVNGRQNSQATSNSTDTVNISMTSLTVDQIDSPPSPNTSQRKIFSMLLSNQSRGENRSESGMRQYITSPTATEQSDSTVASSCSLPLISQLSSSSSMQSYRKHPNRIESMDNSFESEVRMRPESSKKSVGDDYKDYIDEHEEWKKIECIMSSFGSGICRESVFASDFENKVALYLRDRRSQAITLKRSTPLNSSTTSTEREGNDKEEEKRVELWLTSNVQLDAHHAQEITKILIQNGFDQTDLEDGVLTTSWMNILGIEADLQKKMLTAVKPNNILRPTAADFDYLSDWLCSLDLIEYLGNFVNAGFKSMLDFRNSSLSMTDYNNLLFITTRGHIARMMHSLENGSKKEFAERNQRITETKQLIEELHDPKCKTNLSNAMENETALKNCNTEEFSAHYLGSAEISNIDGTEESRTIMAKLKGLIREIHRIPQVSLQISVEGVHVVDIQSKIEILAHDISKIQIVCQDKRDLNCFTYISQDGDRYYCHVFCVLTADVATEVILMMGQTFEMAYSMKKYQYENESDF